MSVCLHITAVSCAEYNHLAATTASGIQLTGTTGDLTTTVCKSGYTFGGATSTVYSKDFTCTASGPAASVWSPDTAAASSHCAGTVYTHAHTHYTCTNTIRAHSYM